MSRYKEIKTEYRNIDSLKKALADLGVHYLLADNVKQPDLPLYGYLGDERQERGSVVIPRSWVNDNWSGGASNDIGFAWDGQCFTALVSEFDSSFSGSRGKISVTAGLNQLRQRYAYHEAMRLARSKGYTVRETATVDGHMRVVLERR